jgi:hypothetical protein
MACQAFSQPPLFSQRRVSECRYQRAQILVLVPPIADLEALDLIG